MKDCYTSKLSGAFYPISSIKMAFKGFPERRWDPFDMVGHGFVVTGSWGMQEEALARPVALITC